ncbi:MAG: hypothetical protein C5B43_03520 [Verrucomicrobia bacterium]|nr:MAG: hypothetical protein C5B43_03520 [Verrucomicrobiota bacterium]
MEKNTTHLDSSNGYSFKFGRALAAGFFATLLLEILILLQGQNPSLAIGKMLLGTEANFWTIILAGAGFCLLVGILYALLYALILAPMRVIPDFVQGLIFAAILTVVAILTFPKLQNLIDTALKRHTEIKAVVAVPEETEKSTEIAKTEEPKGINAPETKEANKKNEILHNFMNHLIYALSVIVIYRQRKRF